MKTFKVTQAILDDPSLSETERRALRMARRLQPGLRNAGALTALQIIAAVVDFIDSQHKEQAQWGT